MRTLLWLCLLPAAAFAQFDNNVITVTASRQMNVQPDQAIVSVTVTTDEKQTLATVLAALPSSVAATNLSGVSGYGGGQVEWVFTLTAPIASLPQTLAMLSAASRPAMQVDIYVSGSSTSSQAAAAQQCPYPALVADARAQAAKLASAAGVTLGPLVTLQQGTVPTAPAVVLSGEFSLLSVSGVLPDFLLRNPFVGSTSTVPSCTLAVQFKIGQ